MKPHRARLIRLLMAFLMGVCSCGHTGPEEWNSCKGEGPGGDADGEGRPALNCVATFRLKFSTDFLEACDVEFVCVSSGGESHIEPVKEPNFRHSFEASVSEFPFFVVAEVRSAPRGGFPADPFRGLNLRYSALVAGTMTDASGSPVGAEDSMEWSQKVATDGENLVNVLDLIFPKIYRLTFSRTPEDTYSVKAELLPAR